MAKESVLKQIRQNFKRYGITAFYPGQHQGECTSKYVVIKHDGAVGVGTVSSDAVTYTIMCYVPKDEYSSLIEFVEVVKQCMKVLFPLVKLSGNETPSYYDDSKKAHMISVEYLNYRKMTNWR